VNRCSQLRSSQRSCAPYRHHGKGERDSVTGDGVREKQRERSPTKSYIRIFK